jgi:hypothetical protein
MNSRNAGLPGRGGRAEAAMHALSARDAISGRNLLDMSGGWGNTSFLPNQP